MLNQNKYMQYGFPREQADILGITIHETDNTDMPAEELEQWLNEVNKTSDGCYHYLCDDIQTIQLMPDDWSVYHTGKTRDWGDTYTISIAICSTLSNAKYETAKEKAIELIKNLMETYSISDEMIFFHNDFNEKVYCPKRILDEYKSVKRFMMEEL